ncbi:hypothetical protein ABIB82_005657 [Bradyrhizobium sp. i1.8.4]|uniref:hypothetical protein n=1 Tax=unclassified Bradyrhizobium TaxID=2631580 RepID=UPI003D1F1B10
MIWGTDRLPTPSRVPHDEFSHRWAESSFGLKPVKDRLNVVKADRDRSKADLERVKSHALNAIQIEPALLERFGRTLRQNFTFRIYPIRKACLQSLISVIEVDDVAIRIKSSRQG